MCYRKVKKVTFVNYLAELDFWPNSPPSSYGRVLIKGMFVRDRNHPKGGVLPKLIASLMSIVSREHTFVSLKTQ
jgi:hypothetical protein